MAKSEAVFIYIGTYPNEAAAQADYEVVKDQRGRSSRELRRGCGHQGRQRQGPREQGRDGYRHGGWGGAAVGALIDCLFPPASTATTAVGRGHRRGERPLLARHVLLRC